MAESSRCYPPRMEASEVRRLLEQYFREGARGVACAWLFGSVSRGDERPNSDVDVAVLLTEDPPRDLSSLRLDLAEELRALLSRPVDLVVLNRAPADLAHRVLRDGQLAFEGDASARVAFEVRCRREYFDLLPMLRHHWHRRERSA